MLEIAVIAVSITSWFLGLYLIPMFFNYLKKQLCRDLNDNELKKLNE
jgi:hypothetical protein